MWYKNIASRFFGLVTKHACDRRTDGQTDGQNYDSQDRASIAASRGKAGKFISVQIVNRVIRLSISYSNIGAQQRLRAVHGPCSRVVSTAREHG